MCTINLVRNHSNVKLVSKNSDQVVDVRLSFDMEVQTEKKPLECDFCQKKFTRRCDLIKHVRFHTGEKPFECAICLKKFTENGHLTNHMRLHTGEKPYECSICLKKFTNGGDLTRHIRIHTGEKPFECKICEKKFSRGHDLMNHIRIHTGEKPFECTICLKKFSLKGDLKRHQRVHTGERPFECSICLKKFTENTSLTKHRIVHTGEKPFECDICFKKFPRNNDLKRHIRSHNGEKIFECDICFKKISTSSGLTWHMKLHSGEKPFDCSVCQKKFITNGSLIRHMRVHTEEKTFECNIYSKRFKHKLNLHSKTHREVKVEVPDLVTYSDIKGFKRSQDTKEKPFECNICSNKFVHKRQLTSHSKTHREYEPFGRSNKSDLDEELVKCNLYQTKSTDENILSRDQMDYEMDVKVEVPDFVSYADIKEFKKSQDTKEKPFECDICSNKFLHKRQLTSHSKIHREDEPFGRSNKSDLVKCNLYQTKSTDENIPSRDQIDYEMDVKVEVPDFVSYADIKEFKKSQDTFFAMEAIGKKDAEAKCKSEVEYNELQYNESELYVKIEEEDST